MREQELARQVTKEIDLINQIFEDFNVDAWIWPHNTVVTPSYLAYKISLGKGVKASKALGLRREIAIELSEFRCQEIDVRISSPSLNIEVPHPAPKTLNFRARTRLKPHTTLLGESFTDLVAKEELLDLERHYHTLVAGQTGSGKSNTLSTIILGFAGNTEPSELRMHLIDLKNDDLTPFKKLPHTEHFASETEPASQILTALDELLESRKKSGEKLPRHLLVIDELVQLTSNRWAQETLSKLIAQGRSCNINIIGGTQQPTAKEVGSIIKANFIIRIVGKVTSPEASKVATGRPGLGADYLSGHGAFLRVENGDVKRFQAHFIEKEKIPVHVKNIINKYSDTRSGNHLILSGSDRRSDTIEELANQEQVIKSFQEFYNPKTGTLNRGGLSRIIHVLYGAHSPTGGWNRSRAQAVIEYLKRQQLATTPIKKSENTPNKADSSSITE